MKRWLVGLTLVLVSCGGGGASTDTPAPQEPSPSPSPCIDEVDLMAHKDANTLHLNNVIKALKRFDLDEAGKEMRLAASESRALADAVASVDPEIETHFLRAADALDQSATSLGEADLAGATSWVGQGVNEVSQAVEALDVSTYCA